MRWGAAYGGHSLLKFKLCRPPERPGKPHLGQKLSALKPYCKRGATEDSKILEALLFGAQTIAGNKRDYEILTLGWAPENGASRERRWKTF